MTKHIIQIVHDVAGIVWKVNLNVLKRILFHKAKLDTSNLKNSLQSLNDELQHEEE